MKRINEEYESEVKALRIQEAKSSNKNLCNSCLRLIEESAQKCPYCGAEVDVKLPLPKEPEQERIGVREFFRRLGESVYLSLASSLRLVPLVIILIIVFGILFNYIFHSALRFLDISFSVQGVLIWGSFVVGCISIICSTTLPTGRFLSAPYLWRLTVPVGRRESNNYIDIVRGRWLVMAGFCLLIFLLGLTIPF
ncbi:MAG: hypothetical protein QXE45_00805 [Thermoplasmata archaeon]